MVLPGIIPRMTQAYVCYNYVYPPKDRCQAPARDSRPILQRTIRDRKERE